MPDTKPRILVADDEQNVRLTLQAILRQEGYDVDVAVNGLEAVTAIRSNYYDLVLTDLKMPEADGLAVLAEVQKRSPNTVTIMMTGYGSLDSALEALQLGAYEYLLKPAEVSEIKLAVRRSLERKRLCEIDTLYSLSRVLTRSLDPACVQDEVCSAVRRVLGVRNAHLIRCGEPRLPQQFPSDLHKLVCDSWVSDRLSEGAILVTDEEPQSALSEWASRAGIRSAVLVPGITDERLACILTADNGSEPFDFHASAQRFLLGVAIQAALAIENFRLVSELRRNNEELRAANRKLREIDKLKSQFLSVATHELRTPITVIHGYNAMLAEDLADRISKQESEALRQSVAACKRLMRLVDSMLDISQIESGRMNMNVAPTDIRELVQNVISFFQPEAAKKGVKLLLELPATLPPAHTDRERIEQVLVNLIGNALKFTPSRGYITVRARSHGADNGWVEISVSDNGVGIAPDIQATLFDEFAFVQRRQHNQEGQGAGLGLAIAKRIVEAHDGTIRVLSALGKGTTVSFTIPRSTRSGATTAISA